MIDLSIYLCVVDRFCEKELLPWVAIDDECPLGVCDDDDEPWERTVGENG
jgi:hypothetical protein